MTTLAIKRLIPPVPHQFGIYSLQKNYGPEDACDAHQAGGSHRQLAPGRAAPHTTAIGEGDLIVPQTASGLYPRSPHSGEMSPTRRRRLSGWAIA
jgi:hypothetical protein